MMGQAASCVAYPIVSILLNQSNKKKNVPEFCVPVTIFYFFYRKQRINSPGTQNMEHPGVIIPIFAGGTGMAEQVSIAGAS